MNRKITSLPVCILFGMLLLAVNASAALSVTVTQSGADSGEVMKARTFTVEANGWSGSCSQATISFPGCSSCSLSGENTQKTIGGEASSVTWTTTSASQSASAQYVSVSVSSGCTLQSADSSNFDIVLPPSLTLTATTGDSTVAKGSGFTINVDVANGGETTANDITFDASTDFTEDCAAISSIDEDNSAAQSCTVTAASSMQGGSQTVTITVSASNADDATDTVSISVDYICGDGDCDSASETQSNCAADCGSPGGPGTPGGPPSGPSGPGITPGAPDNVTMRPTLVPGVGLRDNLQLLAAIEKVLARGQLSDVAKQNMLRLSASITSNLSTTRRFEYDGAKSRIRTTMRYNGTNRANNVMVFESLPKGFANSASAVAVTAVGGTVEVAEDDPSWVILFPEVEPNEEVTILYEVTGQKSDSVLDDMSTEVYAESFGELTVPGQVCNAGAKQCSGDNLQECSSDGSGWSTIESCAYGCDSDTLRCKMFYTPTPLAEEVPWALVIGVVVIVVLIVGALALYMFKFRKPTGHGTISALESVRHDMGQQTETD